MFGAGAAELAEGDGVAAGFGEEVAAVAERVRPLPQPRIARGLPEPSCQAVAIMRLWWAEQCSVPIAAALRIRVSGRPGTSVLLVAYLAM